MTAPSIGRLLAVMAFISMNSAVAASFDCVKAATTVEKQICRNSELSKLDGRVAQEYQGALMRSRCDIEAYEEYGQRANLSCRDWNPELVRDEQRAWLKRRDACGNNVACLKATHKSRIVELTRDLIDNPSGWWLREGMGNEMCNALHRRLVGYRRQDIAGCPTGLALSLPGMNEAGGWQELNPLDHVELINKLRLFNEMSMKSSDLYFETWASGEHGEWQRNEADKTRKLLEPYTYSRQDIEKLMRDDGLRLRVQTLSLIRYSGGLGYGNKVERQTLLEVRMLRKYHRKPIPWPIFSGAPLEGNCPIPEKDSDLVHSYFVTADLADLDRAMRGTEVTKYRLVDYQGKLYFMDADELGVLFRGSYETASLSTFCVIDWHGSNARAGSAARK